MDRNRNTPNKLVNAHKSLSARRAWIEIPAGCWRDARRAVALRKESVDRNTIMLYDASSLMKSLSARRAWIEMRFWGRGFERELSLSARRAWIEMSSVATLAVLAIRRSPQGERG